MPKVKSKRYDKTDSIEALPTAYLVCRVFNHPWEEFIPGGMRKPEFGFRFSLLCTSCGSERHDLINQGGDVVQREYRYAKGYQVSFSAGRDEYRVELNRRKRKRARRGDIEIMVDVA